MADESKRDVLLRRIQIIIALAGAVIGLIVGIYNIRKIMKPEPPPPPVQQSSGSELRLAMEEAGASWIRKLGKAKED